MRQCINIASLLVLLKLQVDYIERVTGMMTDKLVAVSQDSDSSDGTATKQFLIAWILFGLWINVA